MSREESPYLGQIVRASEMKVGYIYSGSPVVGEFQIDKDDGKTVWWKNAIGEIQRVNPSSDRYFKVVKIIGENHEQDH